MKESKLDNFNYIGKRFLITQSSLRLLAGSEIVTLELADFLQKQGAKVLVYTCYFADPIKKFYDEKNIKVDISGDNIFLEDFDYIWVHHQILPISIVNQLISKRPPKMPKFLFFHMSSLKDHYLEKPYVWDLERKISSKTCFVSLAAKDAILSSTNLKDVDFDLFRNPAPVSFSEIIPRQHKTPKDILIVSNHPPEDLLKAKNILVEAGYNVVNLGEGRDKYDLLRPEYLSNFDVVISIGKTVQYCLNAGIPVYIYDRFGGPGYLNESNENLAACINYSGRGFDKKEPEIIAQEIIDDYDKTLKYQLKNRDKFIEDLSIANVLPKVLGSTEVRAIDKFDDEYSQYLIGVMTMMKYKFYYENDLAVLKDKQILTEKNIEKLQLENTNLYKEINELMNSKFYRILRTVAGNKIAKKIMSKFRRSK